MITTTITPTLPYSREAAGAERTNGAKRPPLPYKREPTDIYALMDFNPDEPEAQIEAMLQNPVILYDIMPTLNRHLAKGGRDPEVFLDSDTILCYDRSDLNVRIQPDCYAAFGVDAQAIRDRKVYLPWEVGKPPDFALDVASDSTARYDTSDKMDVYRRIGIPELWLCDSTGGELYGQPLAGWRLSGGEYLPIEMTVASDGSISGYSEATGLHLRWLGGHLRFFDPVANRYLLDSDEAYEGLESERAAHARTLERERAARRALASEQTGHDRTRRALDSEQREHDETRRALDSERERSRRLEEELRRLRGAE